MVVVAVTAYLALAHRRALPAYVLAGLPLALLLGWYNAHYLGSPFQFGQSLVAPRLALAKTGVADPWQTPLWEGAAGVLVSPSRGLLVYSPFMAFAFWGVWVTWRNRTFATLRPLAVAVAALLCVGFKWYDWWGGWSFGYRPVVDTMPLLAVFLIPVLDTIWKRKVLLSAFGTLLAWSVLVQVVGAFAYDVTSWNGMREYELSMPGRGQPVSVIGDAEAGRLVRAEGARVLRVHTMDVDRPEYRYRLWSVRDNQIFYFLRTFRESRERKHKNAGK